MNPNTPKATETKQQTTNSNDNRRDEDQFWTDWWREYAQTWK